jgi:hypothetical protein
MIDVIDYNIPVPAIVRRITDAPVGLYEGCIQEPISQRIVMLMYDTQDRIAFCDTDASTTIDTILPITGVSSLGSGAFEVLPGGPFVCVLRGVENQWNGTNPNLIRVNALTKAITHTRVVLQGEGSWRAMCLVGPLNLVAVSGLDHLNVSGNYEIGFYNPNDLSLVYIVEFDPGAGYFYRAIIYIPGTGKIWAWQNNDIKIDVLEPLTGAVEQTITINNSTTQAIHDIVYDAHCNRVIVSAGASYQLYNPNTGLMTVEVVAPVTVFTPQCNYSTVDEDTGDFFIEDWRTPYKIYQVKA